MLIFYSTLSLWFQILILLFALSCSPKHDNTTPQPPPLSQEKLIGQLLESPESIAFEDIQTLVLEPFCVRCHQSNGDQLGNVVLDQYDAVFGRLGHKSTVTAFAPERSSIYSTLLVPNGSQRMPPLDQPQLTEDQINLVFQWIQNGAKLEVKQKAKRPKTLQEELQPFFNTPEIIDYSTVNNYLFKKECSECHSWGGSKSNFEGAIAYGQNMTTYKDLFNFNGIVRGQLVDYLVKKNGEVEEKQGSSIYNAVAVKQSMPRAKDGSLPTNALLVKLLRLWILNCAIEDYESITEDSLIDSVLREREKKGFSKGKVRDCSPFEPNN